MRFLDDGSALARAIQPYAVDREAELNLLVGLALASRSSTTCAVLEDGARVRAALLCEPPYNVVLAAFDDAAAEAAADALAEAGRLLDAPGVHATARDAAAFARRFAERTVRETELDMGQRILQLTEVVPPSTPDGRFRPARPDDMDHLAPWVQAFVGEVEASTPTLAQARGQIDRGTLFVWDAGELVSMAALARPTWTGVAVNSVYTPPSLRGRGYATACVAALSQHALDAGRAFCMLFTDAANPTSNRIYERIGYRWVCDAQQWRFVQPP